jgi:hypothetical protein
MNVLVTNNYAGSPVLWEYNQGKVERIDLIDFNIHEMLFDNHPTQVANFPVEIYEVILDYVMQSILESRNLTAAFKLCCIDKRTLKHFYDQIYNHRYTQVYYMIQRLSRTFNLADRIYEDYLCDPNPGNGGFMAVVAYRQGSLRYNMQYNPWDFMSQIEVQKLEVDIEQDLLSVHAFPGHFYGDTVWIHGEDNEGIYDTKTIHHPVIVMILCDYSYSLIPSKQTVSHNWLGFTKFLRRTFGDRMGFYMMVKSRIDEENPFIETTDQFVQL